MDIKLSLGLDSSKDKLRCCLVKIDSDQSIKVLGSRSFDNTKPGHLALYSWLMKKVKPYDLPLVSCIEATGVYYERLAYFLRSKQIELSVVLPNKAKRYLQSLGLKSKNDKIDARGLATMGAQRKLRSWQPHSDFFVRLRELTRYRQSLVKQRTAENNRLHANLHSFHQIKEVQRELKSHIRILDNRIKKMEVMIEDFIATQEEIKRRIEGIAQIKGLGVLTIATVVAETNGFELFQNQNQLTSYAGYDVVENQSGKHYGKTKISKSGNVRIRRALHMPAFSVVTHKQTSFYNLHKRLVEKHGIKMKAYVAVQKKLLTTIYALWKKEDVYDNNYYELLEKETGALLS